MSIIGAIEKAALECGTILNLIEFAYDNGYYEKDETTGDWILSKHSLQEIADIFTNGFDVLNY